LTVTWAEYVKGETDSGSPFCKVCAEPFENWQLDHRGLCYRCVEMEDKLYRANHPRPGNIGGEIITAKAMGPEVEDVSNPELPVAQPGDLVHCEDCTHARVNSMGCRCDKGYWRYRDVAEMGKMLCDCDQFQRDGD